ncbi:pre-16S rRNA-processing nuclease YqgF [Phormidium sp. CCY1219]|uniref:pre-16S rRNA-processing nuclease YqgF n=1 Tax=Phormidium sp. CCY1219 TaxID=2886104 RepID=UPI002D1E7D20|nr:pre-16S rRNA-processing nuclease YqgF [Phormidium sp. CCY1219]MEB3829789.1 pre-16S rRNA-processing nuclease YqgF [Phormidium sp. CCY1219]
MTNDQQPSAILGFDPGRMKCGMAVMGQDGGLLWHEVVPSEKAIATIESLREEYAIAVLVMGDQTTSRKWENHINEGLSSALPIIRVDERYTSLQARDRYWEMYPPKGLSRLIPQGMRQPPRPIDDIVAILLIERYLGKGF